MANEKVLKGPYWTRNWIEAMWRFTNEKFVDFDTGAVDYEALGKEEFQFRKALFFRNFKNSERAKMAFASAEDDYKNSVENGKKGGRPKKSPQDAPNGNAGVDMSDAGNGAASKSPTSCDTFTEDGDTREDSHAKTDGSAITRNETRHLDALDSSSNIYGDAATREGADDLNSRESGTYDPTTVSRNMRQSAKTRNTRNTSASCRYAQPSCSSEDGFPAETAPSHGGSVASLEARESQARQSQGRAGADSVRGTPSHRAPARYSGPMPDDVQPVYDFAAAEGLDTADAYECWQVTVNERGGLTADWKQIKNWKAYVRKWCVTRDINRRTA